MSYYREHMNYIKRLVLSYLIKWQIKVRRREYDASRISLYDYNMFKARSFKILESL
jgi:hypothetical protein